MPDALREVVLAPPRLDAFAGDDDFSSPQDADSTRLDSSLVPVPGAEVDTAPAAGDDAASARHRGSAIITGLRWTMIGRPAVEAANLLGVVVLARLVAPVEFGRYAIALIVLALANVPTQAVQYAIVQRKALERDHLKTGVSVTLLMGLLICAVCLAASDTVVPMLFGARTAVLVRLMTPACFINSVNTVQIAVLTRRLEFRRLTLLDITITLVGTVASIPMAMAGLNGEAMVFGVLLGSITGFILLCCWILPPLPNVRLRAARDLLRSGGPAASAAASLVGFQNCDYVIVGARLGPLQAGYYFRAYTLSVVYQKKLTSVLTRVGFPVLSRAATEDEVDRLREQMVHMITLTLFPLLTVLAIVAPRFVTWFYGSEWRAAVVPVQILSVGGGAMLVVEAIAVGLLANGRARAVSAWGWGHFVAYAAAVFAVAHFGLSAIAIAAAFVHTIFLFISYLLLRRGDTRQAFRTLAKDLGPATFGSFGLAAVAVPLSVFLSKLGIPTVPYLLMIGLAGGAGYFVTLRVWFPAELRQVGGIARRLLPARTYRLLGRPVARPETQSVA